MNEIRRSKWNETFRRTLSDIFTHRMRDPRLKNITVFHVYLSPDLRKAKVLVSTMENPDRASIALEKAEGFIRKELAKELNLKYVPELKFHILTEEEKSWTDSST